MLSVLLYILANGCGDRVRGSISVLVGALIFSLCITLSLGEDTRFMVAVLCAYWFGEVHGWGSPVGAYLRGVKMTSDDLEVWQFGVFKTNTPLALLLRGLIWGLPIGVVIHLFGYTQVGIITTLAYTLSFYISLLISRLSVLKDKWGFAEFIRGILVMSIIQGYLIIGGHI